MNECTIHLITGETEVVTGTLGEVQSRLQEQSPFVVLKWGEESIAINPRHVAVIRPSYPPQVG